MSLSIVIPATDKGDREKRFKQLSRLFDSIKEYPWGKELYCLVCFDGCDTDFIHDSIKSYSFITPLVNSKNRLNFARNANRGLRYAHKILGSNVLLINQDCILPPWEILSQVQGDGLVSPTAINSEKLEQPDKVEKILIKSKFPFYCVFINKKVLDKIGYLDGVYISTFEDDNYIARALLMGLTCEISNVKIYHEGSFIDSSGNWESASGSYGPKRLGENLVKFATQWQIPPEIKHEEMLSWIQENHVWEEDMRID